MKTKKHSGNEPVGLHHDSPASPDRRPKLSFWRKLGGGSLSLSLIIHGVLLVVGVVWVYKIIPPPPEKVVNFMPKSGGGGAPASQQKAEQQRVRMMQPDMARVAAVGVGSSLVLPEPDEVSQMTSLGSLSSGGLSAGLGGSGAGGGKGDGTGLGLGSGLGTGLGGAGMLNPFGAIDPNANALVGTFYDLKQTKGRRPTKVAEASDIAGKVRETLEVLNNFIKHDWDEKELANYYQAPQKLYQTKVFMPRMDAKEAPQAFNCAGEVEPSRWVVIYRGIVRPPKTGKYRFVGMGDDALVVRFNGKTIFDYGWDLPSGNMSVRGNLEKVLDGKDPAWKRLRKDWVMPDPVEVRPQGPDGMVKRIGGMGVGQVVDANANTDYPIEILISEIPGGSFSSFLMIEEIGTKYEKDKKGYPILPIFQLDSKPPAKGTTPPYDPKGPVWKLVKGTIKPKI